MSELSDRTGPDPADDPMDSGPPTMTGAAVRPGSIGVAIAIPEPYGSQLQTMRSSFGDPLADAIPTHVTLLPPTALNPGGLDVVSDHLEKVAAQHDPFDMHLRGSATFRPVSPVVFVQLSKGIGECEFLERDVRDGPLGTRTLDFPYHPHVTVAHHLPEDVLDAAQKRTADFECSFVVDGFQLYLHGEDGVWRVARDFWFGSP
jgi:2'-5' RNA ligase